MNTIIKESAPDQKLQADWERQLATAREIVFRQDAGIRTVLLADEVGMGKTYAALATVAMHILKSRGNDRKALLVVPNALLATKWEQEIRSFNENYLTTGQGKKELRPLVVRNYWELIQNLHDYADFDLRRISQEMLVHFSRIVWNWNESRREARRHRAYWPICDKVGPLDPGFLDFCSRFSPLAVFNYLDEQLSQHPEHFDKMLYELRKGMAPKFLSILFRGFASRQDSMEPNIFIVGMGALRRTRSDHENARLLSTYVAAKALQGRWPETRRKMLKDLGKANLVIVPKDGMAMAGEPHLRWFSELSKVDLWGMGKMVEQSLADASALSALGQEPISSLKDDLAKVADKAIQAKLAESNIVLAVIDEVHNWKNGGNGANEFKANFSPFIGSKLLMSATPFQLHQDELGRIFGYATEANDDSGKIVADLLGDGGIARRCLDLSSRFDVSWKRLTEQDIVAISKLVEDTKKPSTQMLCELEAMASSGSDTRTDFSRDLLAYHDAIAELQGQLSRIVIRHTKPREKRHVHAGDDYARSGDPDYSIPHQMLYEVGGLGDKAGALLNYIGMRAEQRVRRDAVASGHDVNAHILNGFSSSIGAFLESNRDLLANPAVSPETRRYLNFFAEILGKSNHPKVTATIERAISNYRAGSKTLIFCERLKTQEEIVAKLKESLVQDFVGAGGIDAVKRERRELLKDHRLVEIYLSRSLLAAQGQTGEISSIVSSSRELVEENLQLIEGNLGHLSDRQRNKVIDLILVGIIGHEEALKQVFQSLRESPSALRTYLRLDNETELEPVDDDPDDDDNVKEGESAIDGILTGRSIWHPLADSKELHANLWRLLRSEFDQLTNGFGPPDPSAVARLLLDLGQGLRKIILRLDTLKNITRTSGESLPEATVRLLGNFAEDSRNTPWQRTNEFLRILVESQGSIRRPQRQASRRQSLWRGVYLRDEEIVTELHGDVRAETRVSRCAAFNSPLLPDILVCTAIGSEGIDLHLYCDEVIHHDLPWNPARVEQRIGRIDRVGSLVERLYATNPERHRLDVGIPFLAYNYDEFQYRLVYSRAQKFEVLLGKPEFTLDIDEVVAGDEIGDKRTGEEDESQSFLGKYRPVVLPQALVELVKMNLSLRSRN